MKQRDKTIDFLRGSSIILIVLIHVLVNYRSFTYSSLIWRYLHFVEALLVFCSGASLAYSYDAFKGVKEILYFIRKRLSRFYFPWWVFLIVFLSANLLFDFISGNPFRYSLLQILKMVFVFGVGGGMGYGWILLVLLTLSIAYPFISLVSQKIGYGKVLAGLIISSFFTHYLYTLDIMAEYAQLVFYSQYLLPFFLGVCYVKIKKLNLLALGSFYFIAHLLLWYYLIISGKSTVFTEYKTPPSLFFMSYGVFVSLFLMKFFKLNFFKKIVSNKLSDFYSKNSMWIYMWHILILGVSYHFFLKFSFTDLEPWWILKFLFVLGICSLLVLLQNHFQRIIKNYINAGINYNMH